jgi:hypothetical protein
VAYVSGVTWPAGVCDTVLLGVFVVGFALRRVIRGVSRDRDWRPRDPPSADDVNDRTPPGI